jgi:hypothetical protein
MRAPEYEKHAIGIYRRLFLLTVLGSVVVICIMALMSCGEGPFASACNAPAMASDVEVTGSIPSRAAAAAPPERLSPKDSLTGARPRVAVFARKRRRDVACVDRKVWDALVGRSRTDETGSIAPVPATRPASPRPRVKLSPPDTQIHVVVPGETLSAIARQYRVRSAQLAKVNKVESSDRLKAGERIIIPRG